jgi:hypothetical protein
VPPRRAGRLEPAALRAHRLVTTLRHDTTRRHEDVQLDGTSLLGLEQMNRVRKPQDGPHGPVLQILRHPRNSEILNKKKTTAFRARGSFLSFCQRGSEFSVDQIKTEG